MYTRDEDQEKGKYFVWKQIKEKSKELTNTSAAKQIPEEESIVRPENIETQVIEENIEDCLNLSAVLVSYDDIQKQAGKKRDKATRLVR